MGTRHNPDRTHATQSTSIKKKLMIKALRKSLGIITAACDEVGINRKTFYRWIAADKKFAANVAEIDDIAGDFVESKLYELINGVKVVMNVPNGDGTTKEVVYRRPPDTAATIFYSKTKLRNRGYQQNLELGANKDVVIEIKNNGNKNSS